MAFIDKIETHESPEHSEAKLKLFNIASKNQIKLIDQFGKERFITPNKTWSNIYMESYVYKNEGSNDPFTGETCLSCFFQTEEFKSRKNLNKKYIYEDSVAHCLDNRFKDNRDVFETNIFPEHPCKKCIYKGNIDCIAIFDIAGSLNGKYTIAIEVVKSSHCSMNKINYCKDNNIFLFEVNYENVLKLDESDLRLDCISMWWIEKAFDNKYRKCSYVY